MEENINNINPPQEVAPSVPEPQEHTATSPEPDHLAPDGAGPQPPVVNEEATLDDEQLLDDDIKKRKKKIILLCVLIITCLIILLLTSVMDFKPKTAASTQERTFTEFPTIQDGEDNEVLGSGNLNNYRDSRSLANIFDSGEDLPSLSVAPDSAGQAPRRDDATSQTASALEGLNKTLAAINEKAQEVSKQKASTSAQTEQDNPRRAARKTQDDIDRQTRLELIQRGYDPDEYFRSGRLVPLHGNSATAQTAPASTSKPTSPSAPTSSSTSSSSVSSSSSGAPATATTPTPKQEETPEAEPIPETKINVKRSDAISSLDGDFGGVQGLSSLDDETMFVDDSHPIKVMFVREEKLRNGQRVSLRLLEDMVIDGGTLLPKNTHLTATCNISERLELQVSSIEINGKIFALNYSAYDIDGAEGIYCAQSKTNQEIKQGTQEAITEGSSILTEVIAGRAASRVVQSGAQMIRSRTGETTVTVTSGYVFYLVYSKN